MKKCFISNEVAMNKISFYLTDNSTRRYLIIKDFKDGRFVLYERNRERNRFDKEKMEQILNSGYWKPYIVKKSNAEKYE